ncbi:MAG: DNA helicase RecG, partial [Candidatus Liptonbacteria bacterium]|nr:DNA helicase RecG [Candidatus Liptonbacteria bacterium]
ERFGLAQIYQFRGRVGRGIHQSYCFLFTESESKSVAARLNAILEAKNGMELAEKDLKLRGPGEFLGQAQTGLPDYAMRGLQDLELVKSSREAAAKIIAKDKTLKKYPELKTRVGEFEREMHLE